MTDDDVPIRVDFRDPATARTWIEETRVKKPFRPRFFAAFAAALSGLRGLRILELGSGPGQLARDDQPRVLERAGFVDVRLLHDEGNTALYRATNPTA